MCGVDGADGFGTAPFNFLVPGGLPGLTFHGGLHGVADKF